MNKPSLIFFDFDGVVLDSASIKTEAFPLVFADYPEHLEAIISYHLAHQGVSRYKKFEWIYTNLLRKKLDTAKSTELGNRFSELVLEKVLKCPHIEGSLALLEYCKTQKIEAVVASGTPQDELRRIIDLRGLNGYFKEIWGSPSSKEEIIKDVLKRKGLSAACCIFIGDASTDYEAAMSCNMSFVAVASPEMQDYWSSFGIEPLKNLEDLVEMLKKTA